MRHLSPGSLRTKFFVASATIFVIFFVLQATLYRQVIEAQVSNALRLNQLLVETVGHAYDEIYEDLVQQINRLTVNEALHRELELETEDETERLRANGRILDALIAAMLEPDRLDTVSILDRSGTQRAYWKRTHLPAMAPELQPPASSFAISGSGRIHSEMDGSRLVLHRRILSVSTYLPVGTALVVANTAALEARMQAMVPEPDRVIAVYDAARRRIARNHAAPELTDDQLLEAADMAVHGAGTGALYHERQDWRVSAIHSSTSDWLVVSAIRSESVTAASQRLALRMLWVGGLMVVAGLILQHILANRIVRPLGQMVEVAERAADGDYARRLEIQSRDELEQLAVAMNRMMAETDRLVNVALMGEIRSREAQIAALSAHINPHLLSNTFECINWLAAAGRRDAIAQVTASLARLIQSQLEGDQLVALSHELAYTRDFLQVYEVLMDGRLAYDIECTPESAQALIPRLSIQPLVENAVLHGIRPGGEAGRVSLSVSSQDGALVVEVSDDGLGMPAAQAAAINAYAQGEGGADDAGSAIGVGLSNLIERLRLLYGDRAQLHVTSQLGWGTSIVLVLPLNGPGPTQEGT